MLEQQRHEAVMLDCLLKWQAFLHQLLHAQTTEQQPNLLPYYKQHLFHLLTYHKTCPFYSLTLYYSGSRSTKTFKPKKNIPEGTHQYELMKHAEATLGSGNLRLAVVLPDGEDQNEWVAVNSKYPADSGIIDHIEYMKSPFKYLPYKMASASVWVCVLVSKKSNQERCVLRVSLMYACRPTRWQLS